MVRHRKPPSQTWRTFLDNHLRQTCRRGLFCRADADISSPVRVRRVGSRSPPGPAFQRHLSSHGGLDGSADSGGLSMGDGSALLTAGSGWNLWEGFPGLRESDGRRGSQDRTAKPVAESLRGASDRIHPQRVFGPRDRLQRAITEAYPAIVHRLLSRLSNSSFSAQGHPGKEAGPTAGDRPGDRDAGCRRAASSLPAESCLRNRDDPSSESRLQPKASFAERTVTCQDSAPRIRGQTLPGPFLDPTSDSSMHDQAHGLPEFGLLVPADGIKAFSNPRMILKRVWVGKSAGVGSDLLSRGQGRGGCEGAGGRSSGACSRSAATFLSMGLRSPRAAVSLRAQPGRREPGGRAKVPAARRPPTTASGSRPAVLSCAAASAAHIRCRSSGLLAAPEKQP